MLPAWIGVMFSDRQAERRRLSICSSVVRARWVASTFAKTRLDPRRTTSWKVNSAITTMIETRQTTSSSTRVNPD